MRNFKTTLKRCTTIFMAAVFLVTALAPAQAFAAEGISGEALLRLKQDAFWVDYTKPQGCGNTSGTDLPNGTPDENGQAIFDFFVSKGLKPYQAAGIIGNMVVESGLMPQRLQGTGLNKITTAAEAANSGSGWGLVQWTPAGKFIKYSAPPYMNQTTAPYESANNLGTQLDFIWTQLEGGTHTPEATAGKDIKATPNLEEAVVAFQGNLSGRASPAGIHYFGYERPADQTGSVSLRTKYARSALTKYGSGAGDSADAVGAINTGGTGQACDTAADLEVMSYNILGGDNDSDDMAGGSSMQRLDRVVKTVMDRNPGIIGFQEVNELNQRNGLKDKLSTYDFHPNIGDIDEGSKRPIYWKSADFSPVKKGFYRVPKVDFEIGQPWVILEHKSSKRRFFVSNAHLDVGPTNRASDNRRDSANIMLDVIRRENPENYPIIMPGDYNSTCERSFRDQSFDELPCTIFKKAGIDDAETVAKGTGGEIIGNEFATSHGKVDDISRKSEHHIDHVFIKSVPKVTRWENIVDDTTRLASDHTPIMVSLVTGIGSIAVDGWTWPVKGNIKTGNCWNVFVPGLGNHAGMDINSTVPGNEAIGAHNGTVVKANTSDNGPAGKYVTVKTDTSPALWYTYQHLASVSVSNGDKVTAGQTKIGIIGVTGRVTNGEPGHLHFVVAVSNTLGSYGNNSQTRDPMKYLPKEAPDNYKCKGGGSSQL